VHKKATISHTSSFVTDDAAASKIRQELTPNRKLTVNFPNNAEIKADSNATFDNKTLRLSIPTIVEIN